MGSRREHKQKRATLEASIAVLCKKFKLDEVREQVLPIFHVTQEEVLHSLKRNKKTLTLENIGLALVTLKHIKLYTVQNARGMHLKCFEVKEKRF